MKLLKFIIKTYVVTEEDMENEVLNDIEPKDKYWHWKSTGIIASEIYKVNRHSKDRTEIVMYGGEKFLVKEDFNSVFEKWEEAAKSIPEDIYREGDDDEPHETSEDVDEEDDEDTQ